MTVQNPVNWGYCVQVSSFDKYYFLMITDELYLCVNIVGPRECTICGQMATYECKECYTHFGDGLDQIAFCNNCLRKVGISFNVVVYKTPHPACPSTVLY